MKKSKFSERIDKLSKELALSPDQQIKKASDEFLKFTVKDKDDVEGYDKVKEALKQVVSTRTGIDSKRKELKREIDNESKRLLDLIEPIESHLKAQKSVRDVYLEAEKKRKEAEVLAIIEAENKKLEEEKKKAEEENRLLREKLAAIEKEKQEANDLFDDKNDSVTNNDNEKIVTEFCNNAKIECLCKFIADLSAIEIPEIEGTNFHSYATYQIKNIIESADELQKQIIL